MHKLLGLLIMLLAPLGVYMTYAQEPLLPGLPAPIILGNGTHTVPDLSMRDMVDILVDFNLVHDPPSDFLTDKYYGITDNKRHTIHVYDMGDRPDKRDTVIHEMLHIRCNEFHIKCTEDEIEEKSAKIYEQLFLGH